MVRTTPRRRRQRARSFVQCWQTWTLPSQLSRRSRRGTRTSTRSCRPSRRSATGSGPTLGPQTTQDRTQSGPRGSREGKQEVQGVSGGMPGTRRQGSWRLWRPRRGPHGKATCRGPRPGHAVGSSTAERSGRRCKGELQSVARAIQRSGATVPASTTVGPNAGSGAAAALACSLTAGCNLARRGGNAQCGDDIDRKWGGRRQETSFSACARDEVSTKLEPERGLETLTAGQWRQKLGLVDFSR